MSTLTLCLQICPKAMLDLLKAPQCHRLPQCHQLRNRQNRPRYVEPDPKHPDCNTWSKTSDGKTLLSSSVSYHPSCSSRCDGHHCLAAAPASPRLCSSNVPCSFVQQQDTLQGALFKPRLARKKFENVVFEPVWREKLFQMKFLALRSMLSNFRPNWSYPRDFSAV